MHVRDDYFRNCDSEMRIAIIGSTENGTQILMNYPANKTIHRIQLPSCICHLLPNVCVCVLVFVVYA